MGPSDDEIAIGRISGLEMENRRLVRENDQLRAEIGAAERWIRKRVWASHGCDGIYGDDGELQCNNLTRHGKPLDFKRMPMDEVLEIDTQCTLESAAQLVSPAKPVE